MRAGIGLLSLLIVAALVFYLTFGTKAHPGYDATVLEKGKVAREQASQISGRTDDGTPITDTITMEEVDQGGQFRRLKVTSIMPGTPMETVYGLKVGDEIIKADDMGVADNNDPGLGKTLVATSYQHNKPIVVLRNDQEMTLVPKDSPMNKLTGQPLIPGLPSGVQVPGN
jgi:hypothetical protein